MGDIGGGIVAAVEEDASATAIGLSGWVQGVQTAILVLDFGKAQAIL